MAFRGTDPDSLANWIVDLDASEGTDYGLIPGARVHSGFFGAYQALSAILAADFNQLRTQYPSYQVLFTGHSLGAAVANLAAVDLLAVHGQGSQAVLYNFGSPRVGNNAYATYGENNVGVTYRVTHYDDIVPHLPGESSDFWHIGTHRTLPPSANRLPTGVCVWFVCV